MAKKEAETNAEAGKEEVPEAPEKIKKKRGLVVLIGVGSVVLTALGVGGFFGYKTFFSQKTKLSAKKDPVAEARESLEKQDKESSDKKSDKEEEIAEAKKSQGNDSKNAEHKDSEHKDSEHKDSEHKDSEHKDDGKKDSKEETKKDEKSDSKTGSKSDSKSSAFGDTYEISRMDLNLGNPIENRFLRIGFSLQYFGGEEQKNELKQREPLIKDLVITSVSTRTRVELVTEKGKEKLRRDLLNRLNEALDKPVKNVFFTDFLVE